MSTPALSPAFSISTLVWARVAQVGTLGRKATFAATLAAVALTGCGGAQKKAEKADGQVAATYDRVQVTERTLTGYTLVYNFAVANPTAAPLTINGGSATYTFCGQQAQVSPAGGAATIPAGGEGAVPFTVTVSFPADSFESLSAFLDQKQCAVDMQGTLATSAGAIPVAAGGNIGLPSIPGVALEGASIALVESESDEEDAPKKKGKAKAATKTKDNWGFTFDVVVKNDGNTFQPYLKRLTFEIDMMGRKILNADKPVDEALPSNSNSAYTFSTTIRSADLTPEQKKQLETATEIDYTLDGTMKLEKFMVPIQATGKLKFSR
jgi:hypothetical protein